MKKIKIFIAIFTVFILLFYMSCKKEALKDGIKKINEKNKYYTPIVNNLRFRKGNSLESEIIRSFEIGEILKLIKEGNNDIINNVKGRWIKVKTDKKEKGWCFDVYLAKIKNEDELKIVRDIKDITKDDILNNKYKDYTETMFIKGCKEGYYAVVKLLIEKNKDFVNLNIKKLYGEKPIVEASRSGDLDIVKLLVENGAIIKTNPKYDLTPLMTASFSGNLELVKFLIEKGAKINEFHIPATDDFDPIRTALKFASEKGHLEIVKYLLQKGANADSSSLCIASFYGHLEIVKILIKNGVDKDGFAGINNRFTTPLLSACSNGQLETVKYLLEIGVDVNKKNLFGNTALILASFYNYPEILELLLKNNAEINAVSSEIPYFFEESEIYNGTALMYSAIIGYKEIVKILINNNADLNMKSGEGLTALEYAIKEGHNEIAELLKQVGAK